jgi:hypothetical protein
MLVVVNFCIDVDIIEVPDFIIKDLKTYRSQFSTWLSNPDTEHSYWNYRDGEKFGCCFRSDAFVEWLNLFPLSNSPKKAVVKEEHLTIYDHSLPCLNF